MRETAKYAERLEKKRYIISPAHTRESAPPSRVASVRSFGTFGYRCRFCSKLRTGASGGGEGESSLECGGAGAPSAPIRGAHLFLPGERALLMAAREERRHTRARASVSTAMKYDDGRSARRRS